MWKVEGAKLLLDRGADVNARAAVDEKALVDKHRFFTPSPNSMTGACLLLNYCWIAARTFRFARNFLAITNSRTKRLNVPHWDTPCSFPQPTALSQAIVQFCCASEERRNKERTGYFARGTAASSASVYILQSGGGGIRWRRTGRS